MVYITKTGHRLPDKIRFDPDEARRVAPDKLVARGLFATREEAARAIELVISMAEEETGTPEKSE
ncbi:MAG: hypothetical protein AAB734_03180 [Patescibacteria group bacterium]